MFTRRTALALGLAVPGLAGLAACGPNASSGGGGGGGEDGSASLRVAWWGNPTRDQNTQDVAAAYEEVAPDVTLSLEPGEWSGYWDKLATQTAGGD
ncbi:MAG: ABC transporter substrate-binding protein, partial [Brachybacterium sp.]